MIISDEQKRNLVDEMEEVLIERRYTHNYSRDALTMIIDEWAKQKSDLLDVLSNHPNWNQEKLMIQFDEDYTRRFEKQAITKFVNWLHDVHGVTYSTFNVRGLPLYFIDRYIQEQFFSPNMDTAIGVINERYPDFKLRNNMKSSKAIGLISRKMGWDKFEGFNKAYSELCDCINPINIRRHTCISVNPIDYLLMSNGDTWTSCHRIGYLVSECEGDKDPGCYSSGTISYMLDDVSFLFYTVDASFNGANIERAKKVQRQIFAYKNEAMLQSRLYPQSNDSGAEHIYTEIREIVQKIMAECLNEPNLWETKKRADLWVRRGNNATCYSDWDNFSTCRFSLLKGSSFFSEEEKMIVGVEPMSIVDGDRHDNSNTIIGYNPIRYVCSECGEIHTDVKFIDGKPYCNDCIFYCNYCGCYHVKSETKRYEYETHSYWNDSLLTQTVCDSYVDEFPIRSCGHRCTCRELRLCRVCPHYVAPSEDPSMTATRIHERHYTYIIDEDTLSTTAI